MTRVRRLDASTGGAVVLLMVYLLTMAPDVTFWDAGEFIASAHSLGIPHPPGTPLFVLLLNVWAKLLPLPYAIATNSFSAVCTAVAGGLSARLVQRATQNGYMAFAAALVAGGMSSVWLNATETEVYAASLLLGVLMIWAGERAGREAPPDERWTYLTAYLIALAVPLHLSALVAAPVAILVASYTPPAIHWRRAIVLAGVFVLAIGAGRVTWWLCVVGAVITVIGIVVLRDRQRVSARLSLSLGSVAVAVVALSALSFLYLRAQFDPAINQGNPATLASLADVIARRQYAVSPMWPREAPVWVQIANLGQYADWQAALSFGPTVMPSVLRTVGTIVFLALGYIGARELWRTNRRIALATLLLFACGALGVLVYLNLHPGPSIGYGILPANAVREARERDYFFVFGFWAWGLWAGIGAVTLASRLSRPQWAGVVAAFLPVVLNWRAVTRRGQPEQSLPRAVAEAFLESSPPNAALFVIGDNDSYPLWYAQQVLGVRRDVAVITIPLLPTQWYRDQIAHRYGLLASDDVARFNSKFETARAIANRARELGRPVAASMQLTAGERERLGQSWTAGAPVYVEGPARADTASAQRWAAWIDARVGRRAPRDAIDPVNTYFWRMLECPRQFVSGPRDGDPRPLDSTCNYR